MLRSVGNGKYVVYDHKGKKRLSKPMSKAGATRRLQQIDYFKSHPKGK